METPCVPGTPGRPSCPGVPGEPLNPLAPSLPGRPEDPWGETETPRADEPDAGTAWVLQVQFRTEPEASLTVIPGIPGSPFLPGRPPPDSAEPGSPWRETVGG